MSSQRVRKALFWCSWLYLAGVVIATAILWGAGDTSCLGTLLLYFPRWILGVPLLPLAALSVVIAHRLLWMDVAISLVLLVPWMGFCCSVGDWSPKRTPLAHVRVLTCNVQGNASDERIGQVIVGYSPDVVLLQECPANVAQKVFDDQWNIRREGELCIASRFQIADWSVHSRESYGGWGTVALRVAVSVADVNCEFVSIHLSTPRPGLEAVRNKGISGLNDLAASTAQRRVESHGVAAWVSTDDPVVIAGDFNTPVESQIYRRDWRKYENAFSHAGWGLGHTKLTRWHGVRIDHILVSPRWNVQRCRVGPDIGSDHRPVIADLELLNPSGNAQGKRAQAGSSRRYGRVVARAAVSLTAARRVDTEIIRMSAKRQRLAL